MYNIKIANFGRYKKSLFFISIDINPELLRDILILNKNTILNNILSILDIRKY